MFKPRWYCGRRTVELLEDRFLRVVVRLFGVEECHVLIARVVGALVERFLEVVVDVGLDDWCREGDGKLGLT